MRRRSTNRRSCNGTRVVGKSSVRGVSDLSADPEQTSTHTSASTGLTGQVNSAWMERNGSQYTGAGIDTARVALAYIWHRW